MNDIKIFENPEFGKVRTVSIDGEPWFMGKDVATALGYSNPSNAVVAHVDDEDKTTYSFQVSGSNYYTVRHQIALNFRVALCAVFGELISPVWLFAAVQIR